MRDYLGAIIIGLFIAVLVFTGIGWEIYVAKGTQRNVTFTVNSLVVKNSQQSSKYLVFTDKGVFQDTDSFLNFKFNSSDVYGNLAVGKKYNCRVFGFRIPFFSAYPDILTCTAVKA